MTKSACDRMCQAQRRGYDVTDNFTVSYQIEGEHERCMFIETYVPAARGYGRQPGEVNQRKEKIGRLMREKILDFIEDFKEIDGLVKFSYDIGDK